MDKIISALIGLARACGSNPKTENTDKLVIHALAFCKSGDEAGVPELVDAIHKEKFTVSPGCATCASPCGNTSDYDMDLLYRSAEEIRQIKLDILSALQATAAAHPSSLSPEDMELIYKALCFVSYDLDKAVLLPVLEQTRALQARNVGCA